jgi:hypothetical protein
MASAADLVVPGPAVHEAQPADECVDATPDEALRQTLKNRTGSAEAAPMHRGEMQA